MDGEHPALTSPRTSADTGTVTSPVGSPVSPAAQPLSSERAAATGAARQLLATVSTVVRGTPRPVELAVTALLAGGHLLIEDVPGTGKTVLARTLAKAVAADFRRVQATPDLSAGEITGSGVWDGSRFSFVPGPVFAHVVLVDELNRTSPRTQAALMEAMDEAAVTVDGVRHPLPDPHLLVATQNPLDQHGTFPLPEGQLDRFMMATGLGYVDAGAERDLVRDQLVRAPVDDVTPVLDLAGWQALRGHARMTHVAEPVLEHAVAVVRATREHPALRLGASARAAVALVRAAQARALLAGRDFVTPDDTKALAPAVLAHRLVLRSGDPRVGGATAAEVVADVLARVPVPLRSR